MRPSALKLELIIILLCFIYIIKKTTHKSKNQKTLNHISFIKKTKEKQQAKFHKSTLYIKCNILHLILNFFNYKQINSENCNESYQIALV